MPFVSDKEFTFSLEDVKWGHSDVKEKEVNKNMESLYQVYLVAKDRLVRIDTTVIAKTEEEAKFNAGVYTHLSLNGLKPSDVTVIVKYLGSVEVDDKKESE